MPQVTYVISNDTAVLRVTHERALNPTESVYVINRVERIEFYDIGGRDQGSIALDMTTQADLGGHGLAGHDDSRIIFPGGLTPTTHEGQSTATFQGEFTIFILWPNPVSPLGAGYFLRLRFLFNQRLYMDMGHGSDDERCAIAVRLTRYWATRPNEHKWIMRPLKIGTTDWVPFDEMLDRPIERKFLDFENREHKMHMGLCPALKGLSRQQKSEHSITDSDFDIVTEIALVFRRSWRHKQGRTKLMVRNRLVVLLYAPKSGHWPIAFPYDGVHGRSPFMLPGHFWLQSSESAVDPKGPWLLALRLVVEDEHQEPLYTGRQLLTPTRLWNYFLGDPHLISTSSLARGRDLTFVPEPLSSWKSLPSVSSNNPESFRYNWRREFDSGYWLRFEFPRELNGHRVELGSVVPPAETGPITMFIQFPNVRTLDSGSLRRPMTVEAVDTEPLQPVIWQGNGFSTASRSDQLFSFLIHDGLAGPSMPVDSRGIQIGALRFALAAKDRDANSEIPENPGHIHVRTRTRPGVPEPAYELNLRIHFRIEEFSVGGQDPRVGAEATQAEFQTSPPITIPMRAVDQAFILEVEEKASKVEHHHLSFKLQTPEGLKDKDLDVVIIDTEPFNTARIRGKLNMLPGKPLATLQYGGAWNLASEDDDQMALMLPPQVIGETMIKGSFPNNAIPDTILQGERIMDFRLPPPARLMVDRSLLPRSRTIAPWNLRRIFSFAGNEAPGLALLGIDTELLYGLPFYTNQKGWRLAELDGWLGRIPVPSHLIEALRNTKENPSDLEKIAHLYADNFRSWYLALQNRAALFMPYRNLINRNRAGVREQERFDRDIHHRFRANRETANPFTPNSYAARTPSHDQPALHGGVDWLFESENIYDETTEIKPGAEAALSTDSEVEGLALGPLGGSGSQKAEFNEKTIITSVTQNGRTVRITLTRIGRIAMLWNRAKHVIVYERTVKTAARYVSNSGTPLPYAGWSSDQPDEFEGLALMRKVREYIEISQPERAYPDGDVTDRSAGSLIQSRFETTLIDVRSEWGYDTETGWAMPLSGPVAPEKRAFYPKPAIHLKLATSAERGGKGAWQQLAQPNQLLFYTSTLRRDRGDTDKWPAVPDIDFPVFTVTRPPDFEEIPAMTPALNKLPDAGRQEIGLRRFSVDLLPAPEPINLMHGRGAPPMESCLFNLSLARALPSETGEAKAGTTVFRDSTLKKAERTLADRVGLLHALAHQNVTELTPEQKDLAKQTLGEIRGKIGEMQTGLSVNPGSIISEPQHIGNTSVVDWQSQQDRLLSRWNDRFNTMARDIKERLLDEIKHLITKLPDPSNEKKVEVEGEEVLVNSLFLRERLLIIAEETFTQVRGQIKNLTPLSVLFAGQLDNVRNLLADTLSDHLRAITGSLKNYLDQWENNTISNEALRHGASTLLAPIQRGLMELIDETLDTISERTGGLTLRMRGDFLDDGKPSILRDTLVYLSEAIADTVDHILNALARDGGPDIEEVHLQLDDLTRDLNGALEGAFDQIQLGIAEAGDGPLTELNHKLECFLSNLENEVKGFIDRIDPDNYRAVLANIHKEYDKLLSGAHTAAEAELKNLLTSLENSETYQELVSSAKDVIDQFNDYIKAVPFKDLENHLEDLDELRKQLARDTEGFQRAWRPMVDLTRETLRGEFLSGNPGQIADKTLRLVRAWGDAPVGAALNFTRDRLAYYYDPVKEALAGTPAAAFFNELGNDISNALSIKQPFREIADRFVPDLSDFDFRDLFPDFAGLKLTDLLPDLDIKERVPSWVKIRHGVDKKQRTAWADCRIDKKFLEAPALFDIGPITISLSQPHFKAFARVEVDQNGRTTNTKDATIEADLAMTVNGQDIVTFPDSKLHYRNDGKLDFIIKPETIELAPTLSYISDALSTFVSNDSGFSFMPLPQGGISARLDLPLPDLGFGAFSITSLSLNLKLDLLFVPRFSIRTAFWLSRPNRPFAISILFLGGGGFLGAEVDYTPPRDVRTMVTIGIAAGATASVNLGVATGTAGVYFTLAATYESSSGNSRGSGPSMTIGLTMYGELRVLGIASVYLGIGYSVTYRRDGSLIGNGWLSVRIKICWCVKINVSRSVQMVFAGSGANKRARAALAKPAMMAPESTAPASPSREAKVAYLKYLNTLGI